MALKFLDGFEQYETGTNLFQASKAYQVISFSSSQTTYKWTSFNGSNNTIQADAGTFRTAQTSSKSLYFLDSALFMTIPTNQEVVIGLALYPTSLANGSMILHFANSPSTWGASAGLHLYYNADGSIHWYNRSTSTDIVASGAGVITPNTWVYIEMKVSFGASAACEVRVNGTNVASASAVNTLCGLASVSGFNIGHRLGGGAQYYDDFYICDTTGTVNNDFLGAISVYTLFPSANGTTNNFTVTGAASNYLAVNTATPVTTTYVSSAVTNDKELYQMSDLPITPSSVMGVMVRTRSQKGDSGARNQQLVIRTSGTEANSSDRVCVLGTWISAYAIFEKQADGTTAWDGTAVNAMEVGFKNT